jgi:hypothetical protein
VTGRLTGEPETEFQVRIPQEWHWLAVNGILFERPFVPSRSARWQPETGAFGGWTELRSRERKPLMHRALCRLIPAVMNQSPAVDQVCRIAAFGRDNHASKARTRAGEWADYLFFRRNVNLPKAFHADHLAGRGEVGRRPGEAVPPRRAPNNEKVPIAPASAVKVNFASAHAARTLRALSLYLLQWCVF